MTSPSPEVVGLMIRLGNALGTAARPNSLTSELTKSLAGVRSLFSAAACSCALAEPDGSALRFVAADGAGAEAIVDVRVPIGRGIAGWVAMSGQPVIVSDVARDARFAREVAESTAYVPQSIMAAPLIDDTGEVAGVVEVLDPTTLSGQAGRELDVLGLLASQIAAVVGLSRVYDALGDTLIQALAGASSQDDFGQAVREISQRPKSESDLTALAIAFQELAVTGPEGAEFATTVLRAAVTFAQARR